MGYEKQAFQSGQKLFASQLNAMDDQIAANAQAVDEMDTAINGKIVEITVTDTVSCTAGIHIDANLSDANIPEGTEYTVTLDVPDEVSGGGITLYDVGTDGTKNNLYQFKNGIWTFSAQATRNIRRFSLYSSDSAITGDGTITVSVVYSADTVNSVEKRLSEVQKDVGSVKLDMLNVKSQSDELVAIMKGTEYTRTEAQVVACTQGVSLSGSTILLYTEVSNGKKFTFTLSCDGVLSGNITVYGNNAAGERYAIGVLKDSNGHTVTALAEMDIIGFSLYAGSGNVVNSGEITLTVSMTIEASESLSEQISGMTGTVQGMKDDVRKLGSILGCTYRYYNECLEIGAEINNDNNATYIYHDINFDIGADECVGVSVGAVENATAAVIGYISGSADGTEYTQLQTFKTAGEYHVYPPAEHQKIRVRLYPSTTGGLTEEPARFRDMAVFTSGDGRRRVAQAYAPRAWDVPAYYLRDGYMDGKIDEIMDRVNTSGGDCDVFFFTTDQHWRFNTGVSPALVGYIARRLNIQRLFFGGDWADGYNENGILAFHEAFDGKIYNVLGNHDYMNYWCRLGERGDVYEVKDLTPAMATFQLISRTDDIVLGDTMYGYYYVDNPTNRMRYIVLQVFTDESAVHLEQAQLDWLDGALSSMPDGYLAVVLAHYLGNVADDGTTTLNSATGVPVAQVCDRYAAKVACMFNGHTHRDGMVKTDGGIPVFVTTCDAWSLAGLQEDTENPRVAGTRTEQVVEVVIVDKLNHKVSAVRIGCPARVVDDTTAEVREQTFVGA